MKKTSFLHKTLICINIVFALLLLVAFLGALINPKHLKFISLISLGTPFLLIVNVLFIIFWIIQTKRAFFISTIIIALGYQSLGNFYRISNKEVLKSSDTKLMSYNVRLFNEHLWIKKVNIPKKISSFFKKTNPDILCLQEYTPKNVVLTSYSHRYVKLHSKKRSGVAIFSKYPIISSGSLNFPNTYNNAIFADIIKGKDTIRIYNVHLQSLKINPQQELDTQKTKNLLRRIELGFKKQVAQVEMLQEHEAKSPYRTIICGDFNNTAFSWVYNQLKNNKKDAFRVAGTGFGKTYNYLFPFRIDFILANENIEINHFKTYTEKYSDHYPIMARLDF
ncbi:MAG: endonuclease/exonuclease/phosphatase family protein [Flavobacteriaceae bacterium]|nr:endonuclease/exonuclease/phosphatase family protein [Flavobacteriaceae bacterium]